MNAIKGLLSSKKAIMAVLSAVCWVGAKVGLDVDAETLYPAIAPLWIYVLSQGIADHGKEKAKIEASAASVELTASVAANDAAADAAADKLPSEAGGE